MKNTALVWSLVNFIFGKVEMLAKVVSIFFFLLQFVNLQRVAVWARLQIEGIAQFSLSPGKSPAVAVFVPEKKASVLQQVVLGLN